MGQSCVAGACACAAGTTVCGGSCADVQSDLDDAHAITRGDYNGYGHARRGEALQFPLCKNVDCFRFFGRQKPAGAL
jgi:hypothetical protein